jgi:WD40 repeat protein
MQQKRFFLLFLLLFSSHLSSAQLFKLSNTLTDNNPAATVLKLKPDGTMLVEGDEAGNLILRRADNGSIIKTTSAHSAAINNIDFNSTGRLAVSSSQNGEIRIYDFQSDRFLNHYKVETTNMRFAVFSIADGFIYFNTSDKLWKIRSYFNREAEELFVSAQPITAAAMTHDRNSIIFTSGNYIYVLNTRTDQVMQQLYTGDATIEKLILLSDNELMSWSADGTVKVWTVTLGQVISTPAQFFKAGPPSNVCFSFDNKWMATANSGNWARIWNLKDKTIAQELFGHTNSITAMAFSSDAGTLFTASKDLSIKVWKQKPDSVPPPPVTPKPAKKDTVVIAPPEPEPAVNKDVEMASADIPAKILGRTVMKTQTIQATKSTLDIYIYDNGIIDGDTMSLFFNGNWLLRNYGTIRAKKKITLEFNRNSNNYLVLFAENLGKKPPNTAVIEYTDEKGKHIIRLSSDLSMCRAINFVY